MFCFTKSIIFTFLNSCVGNDFPSLISVYLSDCPCVAVCEIFFVEAFQFTFNIFSCGILSDWGGECLGDIKIVGEAGIGRVGLGGLVGRRLSGDGAGGTGEESGEIVVGPGEIPAMAAEESAEGGEDAPPGNMRYEI